MVRAARLERRGSEGGCKQAHVRRLRSRTARLGRSRATGDAGAAQDAGVTQVVYKWCAARPACDAAESWGACASCVAVLRRSRGRVVRRVRVAWHGRRVVRHMHGAGRARVPCVAQVSWGVTVSCVIAVFCVEVATLDVETLAQLETSWCLAPIFAP